MPDNQSPEERLNELKKQLQEDEAKLDLLTKKRDSLKGEVEVLAKSVDEIKKATTAFGQGAASLDQEVKVLEAYYHTKTQMVEAALGENKDEVDAKIKEVDDSIRTKKAHVTELEGKAKTAADEYDAATKNLEAKQQAADRLKNYQKILAENIKKLKDYRTKIEQCDDQNNPACMYVYVQELKKLLDHTSVPSQDEFEKDLNQALEELGAAKEDAKKKKLASDAAKDDLSKGQAELKALETNRVQEILKRL